MLWIWGGLCPTVNYNGLMEYIYIEYVYLNRQNVFGKLCVKSKIAVGFLHGNFRLFRVVCLFNNSLFLALFFEGHVKPSVPTIIGRVSTLKYLHY